VVDLKPEDDQTDMVALRARALAMGVQGPSGGGTEGLRFIEATVVPIAFGLKKVVLRGTLPLEGGLGGASPPAATIDHSSVEVAMEVKKGGDAEWFADVEMVCEALSLLEGALSADEVDVQPCRLR
jgi:hypothetical protein